MIRSWTPLSIPVITEAPSEPKSPRFSISVTISFARPSPVPSLYSCTSLKVRSHQRTQTGFWLRLAWDRTLGCVHTRLVWLWTSREYAMWEVSFISIFVLLVHTAVHVYSGRLPHHGNQSISSPKSVRLRSHLLESDLSFFPSPPRLGGLKSCTNWVQIQSACVHTRGLAIQIQSKSAGVNAPLEIHFSDRWS